MNWYLNLQKSCLSIVTSKILAFLHDIFSTKVNNKNLNSLLCIRIGWKYNNHPPYPIKSLLKLKLMFFVQFFLTFTSWLQLVVRMECSGLDCGRRPAGTAAWNQSVAAAHGDWPWQVALSRNGGPPYLSFHTYIINLNPIHLLPAFFTVEVTEILCPRILQKRTLSYI